MILLKKALLISFLIWYSGYINLYSHHSNFNKTCILKQRVQSDKSISDPIKLYFEFSKTSKLEDGTPVNLFIEKGKKNYIDGDYVWTKMVPFYASSGYKYVFEYQMDCTDNDMTALISWLQVNLGENVRGGSIDKPNWFKQEMTLSEVYEYCKRNGKKITMGYFNQTLKREAIIIIDTGSTETKTSSEIGLVYMIYN